MDKAYQRFYLLLQYLGLTLCLDFMGIGQGLPKVKVASLSLCAFVAVSTLTRLAKVFLQIYPLYYMGSCTTYMGSCHRKTTYQLTTVSTQEVCFVQQNWAGEVGVPGHWEGSNSSDQRPAHLLLDLPPRPSVDSLLLKHRVYSWPAILAWTGLNLIWFQ